MTDEQPILDPPWKELVKVASGWEYGSMHTHEEISDIIRITYGTQEYYHAVNTAIDKLINEYHKRLKNVHDKGYRMLKPVEHITEAVYDAKRGVRQIKVGIENIDCSPVNQMSHDQIKTCERTRESLARIYVKSVDGVTEAAQIAGIARPQKMLGKGKED